ncbi:hypothetical protein GCM10027168_10380 [Streptomyces capparidis]
MRYRRGGMGLGHWQSPGGALVSMTEEARTSEPRTAPAVSVVGPGDIDAMSRYATEPAADLS